METSLDTTFRAAVCASWIQAASSIIVTAGAGMSVDSGLPDFRGPEGFWRAYPPFEKLGKRFEEMSNPQWFIRDPKVAWGFFGHRLQLYDRTVPHKGYNILRQWQEKPLEKKMFVFTSNVDGAFLKAGFRPDQLVECHGSGTYLQCCDERCAIKFGPYPTPKLDITIDMESITANPLQMPRCPRCKKLARPNILMFDDGECDMRRVDEQLERMNQFERTITTGLLVIEFGAGTFVPTVRRTSERLAREHRGRLIRVNVREPEIPSDIDGLSVALGAKSMLDEVNEVFMSQFSSEQKC